MTQRTLKIWLFILILHSAVIGSNLSPVIKLSRVTALPGSIKQVSLNVENFPPIGALSLKIHYNPTAVIFSGVQNSYNGISISTSNINGVITLGWFDPSAKNPLNINNGLLTNLIFTFSAGSSDLEFIIQECELSDGEGSTIDSISYLDGLITEYHQLYPPLLLSPSNGIISDTTVQFKWATVQGAIEYHLEIDEDSLFNSPLLEDLTVFDTSISLKSFQINTKYFWRVRAKNESEYSLYSDIFNFIYLISNIDNGAVQSKNDDDIRIFPNPFNSTTTIKYEVANNTNVKISVINILGKEVAVLMNEYKVKGIYEMHFNANDLTSGFYIIILDVGRKIKTGKFVLLK